MTDIVLLSKIYYSCDIFSTSSRKSRSFKTGFILSSFDFLREYYSGKDNEIKQAVETYIEGNNASIYCLFP